MVYSFHSIVKFALNLREIHKKQNFFCKFFKKSDFGKPKINCENNVGKTTVSTKKAMESKRQVSTTKKMLVVTKYDKLMMGFTPE